jgi:hypothetical protein
MKRLLVTFTVALCVLAECGGGSSKAAHKAAPAVTGPGVTFAAPATTTTVPTAAPTTVAAITTPEQACAEVERITDTSTDQPLMSTPALRAFFASINAPVADFADMAGWCLDHYPDSLPPVS